MRMDKALLLGVGGLLTAFALIPDQSGEQLVSEAPKPSAVSPEPETAPAAAQSYVVAPANPTYEPAAATVSQAERPPVTGTPDHSDAVSRYHEAREAQRARVNAQDIATQL